MYKYLIKYAFLHFKKLALALAARAYVMEVGRFVTNGKSKDLINNDDVNKAYLGI